MDTEYIRASDIDQRITEIEDQLTRLPIELQILRNLRSSAIEIPGVNGSRPKNRLSSPLGPSKAVLHLLATEGPKKTNYIIAALKDRVESSATDIKRSLYSTISNLKNNSLIVVVFAPGGGRC